MALVAVVAAPSGYGAAGFLPTTGPAFVIDSAAVGLILARRAFSPSAGVLLAAISGRTRYLAAIQVSAAVLRVMVGAVFAALGILLGKLHPAELLATAPNLIALVGSGTVVSAVGIVLSRPIGNRGTLAAFLG